MQIIFSRHAKRRAKLYKIAQDLIIEILKDSPISPGKNEIVKKVKNLPFPIKIVYRYEKDKILVITNYPLKKEKKI